MKSSIASGHPDPARLAKSPGENALCALLVLEQYEARNSISGSVLNG